MSWLDASVTSIKTFCGWIKRANPLCRVGSFFESRSIQPGDLTFPILSQQLSQHQVYSLCAHANGQTNPRFGVSQVCSGPEPSYRQVNPPHVIAITGKPEPRDPICERLKSPIRNRPLKTSSTNFLKIYLFQPKILLLTQKSFFCAKKSFKIPEDLLYPRKFLSVALRVIE